MNIKSAVGELAKPQQYVPQLAGGVVGILGSVYAIKAMRDVVGLTNLTTPADPNWDWVIKGGWTAAMIIGMASVKPTNPTNSAIHTALLAGAISGTVMLVSKQFPAELGPYVSLQGRAGPIARGGVRVIGRGAAGPTPTYAQATPVAVRSTPSDVIQAF